MRMWVEILKAVPNSVFVVASIPAAGEAGSLAAATEMGLQHVHRRIHFQQRCTEGMSTSDADRSQTFACDTPLCNGHTTEWMFCGLAVPVVTLPLVTLASRVRLVNLYTGLS
ncbi:O glycosyltransferase [Fasciola gigantica]|uniref:O glycosyltransferase n=1 Tax=Fasciola gigantica TaxID=46835 RepID=A0A504YUU1_FASGI|nr:O glycosyltransferase [Fasciola gigantica]